MQAIGTLVSTLAIHTATIITSVTHTSTSLIAEDTHGTATEADHGIMDVTSALATTATSAVCATDGIVATIADTMAVREITIMATEETSIVEIAATVSGATVRSAALVAETLPTAVPPATSQDVVSEAVMRA